MRQLIKQSLLFISPIILLYLSVEFLVRGIPNDYSYKREYLDRNSDSIKVLFLGSSHAFFGINPSFIKSRSFNAGNFSQSLKYDHEILRRYDNKWSELRYIVMSISYPSLFTTLETGIESWRVRYYMIYYHMNSSAKTEDYFEILSDDLLSHLTKIYSHYLRGKSYTSCSHLGSFIEYNSYRSHESGDLVESGKTAARRHTVKDDTCFYDNMFLLRSIIEHAREKNIMVILYTPPAFWTYVKYLDKKQIERTIHSCVELSNSYQNVLYVNYLTDNSFMETDFSDADHLNEIGAEKLSRKIDSLISNMR